MRGIAGAVLVLAAVIALGFGFLLQLNSTISLEYRFFWQGTFMIICGIGLAVIGLPVLFWGLANDLREARSNVKDAPRDD